MRLPEAGSRGGLEIVWGTAQGRVACVRASAAQSTTKPEQPRAPACAELASAHDDLDAGSARALAP